jgi:hypothetical protein
MISHVNQGGTHLGKKYFELFKIAGEEKIPEHMR